MWAEDSQESWKLTEDYQRQFRLSKTELCLNLYPQWKPQDSSYHLLYLYQNLFPSERNNKKRYS